MPKLRRHGIGGAAGGRRARQRQDGGERAVADLRPASTPTRGMRCSSRSRSQYGPDERRHPARRNRRIQVRRAAAARWRSFGAPDRSRSRAGGRRTRPAGCRCRRLRACRSARRRRASAVSAQLRHRHRYGDAGRRQRAVGARRLKSVDGAWSIDTFEFRAPGATQVQLSGRLGGAQNAAEFAGPLRSIPPIRAC